LKRAGCQRIFENRQRIDLNPQGLSGFVLLVFFRVISWFQFLSFYERTAKHTQKHEQDPKRPATFKSLKKRRSGRKPNRRSGLAAPRRAAQGWRRPAHARDMQGSRCPRAGARFAIYTSGRNGI
jgi:hypothetical protein